MKTANGLSSCLLLVVVVSCVEIHVAAQTTPKAPRTSTQTTGQQKKRAITTDTSQQLIVDDSASAPQVVTLLHRLSGLKMFRLLRRSGEVEAIARLDEGFDFTGNVHTNVIAGLALDDGETIAAWLPEVEAEIAPPLSSFAPPLSAPAPPRAVGSAQMPIHGVGNWFQPPNLTVIARDHRRLAAQYVGLDGMTGLSLLKLPPRSLQGERDFAKEESLAVGQVIRLFGPEPVPGTQAPGGSPVYVRVGETKGSIIKITRSPSGSVARVEISSVKVSPANIGGIAINDAGETLGIVASVKGTEATILPAGLIRNAARRVLARKASVPRPWLGVRGEPLGLFASEQLLRNGWRPATVESLMTSHGILLTSVTPGSPASQASLRPGDVILSVNDGEIRGGEHFSWLIEEAGSGGNLMFTIVRRDKPAKETLEVKLGEAPSPLFGLQAPMIPSDFQGFTPGFETGMIPAATTLIANGLETIALRPPVAARLGSNGGLLVIGVQPETMAYRAGLRPNDVIEAINGKRVGVTTAAITLSNTPGEIYSFRVVRNRQRLEISFVVTEGKK